MTSNGVMAVILRYFTEFGKPALQKMICGRIYARVYCIFSGCTTSSQRKFTFAISSPDEFLVVTLLLTQPCLDTAGLGTSDGHIYANQESRPWWCDVTEVVSKRFKAVHSLSVCYV